MAKKDRTGIYATGAALLLLGGIAFLGRSKKSSAAQKDTTDKSDGGADREGSAAPTDADIRNAGSRLYDELAKCLEVGQIQSQGLENVGPFAVAVGQGVACIVEFYSSLGIDIKNLPDAQQQAVNKLISEVVVNFVAGVRDEGQVPSRLEWVTGWLETFNTAINPAMIPAYIINRVTGA